MTQDTVNNLTSNKYQLYAFKGVQTSASGYPVVWFVTTTFGLTTAVKWSEQYQAYTTTGSLVPGGSVTATNPYNINLHQTFDVTGSSGTGVVVNGGVESAITIANQTSPGVPFIAGISEIVGTSSNPLCAFTLFGTTTLQIAPVEQVLLMFATQTYNTGAVIENAFTSGVLVDLTASNQRSVNYDINTGWSSLPTAGASWAQLVSNNAPLAPLLIDTPTATASRDPAEGRNQ
jgi:hypothetical protein